MQVSSQGAWQQRIAALEAQEAARREQLRCIAHDLASPLTPMRLQLSLWKENGMEDAGLQRLERSIERMTRLVEDVADLASIGCAGVRVDMQPADLEEVVAEAIEAFSAQAAQRQIALRAMTRGPLRAHVDPARIVQVLDNLLRNALKFTPAGGVVTVEAEAVGDAIHLWVADTGRGLSTRDISRLFRPYSQLQASDAGRGTGLGLFICKRIVDAHGGSIWAESAGRGRGSRFVLRLPVLAGERGVMQPAGNQSQLRKETVLERLAQRMARKAADAGASVSESSAASQGRS